MRSRHVFYATWLSKPAKELSMWGSREKSRESTTQKKTRVPGAGVLARFALLAGYVVGKSRKVFQHPSSSVFLLLNSTFGHLYI